MHPLSVAFVWHQHQPYYPDDVAGVNPMPWVRLHGTKDYWGMAMHLREVPEMRASINLVPSLIAQIKEYTDENAQDEHLRVSRLPADSLSEVDRHFLLDNFFMANPEQMIRPYPRYWELYQQRGLSVDSAARASRRFTTHDVLDLQCWGNLTWFHPLAFEVDAELAEFRAKGQHWTEDEKQWLLDKQMELLAEVIPLHRELAKSRAGRADHDPVLPSDSAAAGRQAAGAASDAARGVAAPPGGLFRRTPRPRFARAVEYHTQVFGSPPRGHVALGGFGGAGDRAAGGGGGHRVDRQRRGDSGALDRRLGLARRAGHGSAIPRCSIGPGSWKRVRTSWR